MFGPANLDDVSVQVTYIEAGKTGVGVSGESSSRKEDKRKWAWKKGKCSDEKGREALLQALQERGA